MKPSLVLVSLVFLASLASGSLTKLSQVPGIDFKKQYYSFYFLFFVSLIFFNQYYSFLFFLFFVSFNLIIIFLKSVLPGGCGEAGALPPDPRSENGLSAEVRLNIFCC